MGSCASSPSSSNAEKPSSSEVGGGGRPADGVRTKQRSAATETRVGGSSVAKTNGRQGNHVSAASSAHVGGGGGVLVPGKADSANLKMEKKTFAGATPKTLNIRLDDRDFYPTLFKHEFTKLPSGEAADRAFEVR